MKKIRDLFQRFTADVFGNMSFVEIHGLGEIIISGCLKIIDYSNSAIVCETISGTYSIDGEDLLVDIFREDVLCVKGLIKGVTLSKSYDN